VTALDVSAEVPLEPGAVTDVPDLHPNYSNPAPIA
jgi:hypothetical protein